LLALASGCGPRYGNVSGKVTYQGKPVTGGTITFHDSHNGVASDAIQPDGSYSVNRVAAGQVRITVVPPLDIPFRPMQEAGGRPTSPGSTPRPVPLPPKYADPAQSGLTCEVQAGNQEHDVNLN
jgi:hypothetical protein